MDGRRPHGRTQTLVIVLVMRGPVRHRGTLADARPRTPNAGEMDAGASREMNMKTLVASSAGASRAHRRRARGGADGHRHLVRGGRGAARRGHDVARPHPGREESHRHLRQRARPRPGRSQGEFADGSSRSSRRTAATQSDLQREAERRRHARRLRVGPDGRHEVDGRHGSRTGNDRAGHPRPAARLADDRCGCRRWRRS